MTNFKGMILCFQMNNEGLFHCPLLLGIKCRNINCKKILIERYNILSWKELNRIILSNFKFLEEVQIIN